MGRKVHGSPVLPDASQALPTPFIQLGSIFFSSGTRSPWPAGGVALGLNGLVAFSTCLAETHKHVLEASGKQLSGQQVRKQVYRLPIWEEHHQLVGCVPEEPQPGSLIRPLATARLGTESQR